MNEIILKNGVVQNRKFRVLLIEVKGLERKNYFSVLVQMKIFGIWRDIKSWSYKSDEFNKIDEAEVEFIKNEAIELFNKIVYPYKNI